MKMILDKNDDKELINVVRKLVEDQILGLLRNDEDVKKIVETAVVRYINKSKEYIKSLIKNEIYNVFSEAEEKGTYYRRSYKYLTNEWIKKQMLKIISETMFKIMPKINIKIEEK